MAHGGLELKLSGVEIVRVLAKFKRRESLDCGGVCFSNLPKDVMPTAMQYAACRRSRFWRRPPAPVETADVIL